MNNANSWDDVYDDDDLEMDQDPSQGSNLVKDLRKQLKAKARENKDLSERLGQLESSMRNRTISDVLTSKGLSPKIAKLMPSDLEPTADKVEAWLTEFADIFSAPQEGQEPTAESNATQAAPTGVSGEDVQALQRMGQTQLTSTTPPVGAQEQQLKAISDPNLTPEQLDQMVFAAKRG